MASGSETILSLIHIQMCIRDRAKVQEEREKLETYEQMMTQVTERLNGLKAK